MWLEDWRTVNYSYWNRPESIMIDSEFTSFHVYGLVHLGGHGANPWPEEIELYVGMIGQ